MRSETLTGNWFFDVAVLEKLENVININILEVVSLDIICFVTFSCCHDDFFGGGTDGPADVIKTSEL